MEARTVLLEGIARRVCVAASYNGTQFKLAPHILYTRHDELYVDAVALEKNGEPPREIKLGTFKLTGLNDVAVMNDNFAPETEHYDPALAKYDGTTVFAV